MSIVASAMTTAGCGSFPPKLDLPPSRQVMPARGFPGLRDYRGVINCRTSGSALDQSKLAELASEAQLDFVCLTNRANGNEANLGIGGFTNGVLFITGAAFPRDGGGEILGLNLHEPLTMEGEARDLIGAIHRQDGVALAAAISRFPRADDYALADGLEVYNQEQAWNSMSWLALHVGALFLSPNALYSRLDSPSPTALAAFDRMALGARVALTAGVGSEPQLAVLGYSLGRFEQSLGVVTTHLLAPERAAGPLMDALKRGHAYVAFDILGYVPEFAFYAEGPAGRTMMGDEAALQQVSALKVELAAPADEIVLVASGVKAGTGSGQRFEFRPEVAGAYRVVAMRRGRPWIMSNPVYLR